MNISQDQINQLLDNTRDYNSTADAWVNTIAHALTPIALIILSIFAYLEVSTQAMRFRETNGAPLSLSVLVSLSAKYFVAFFLVYSGPMLVDFIFWFSNAIGHLILNTNVSGNGNKVDVGSIIFDKSKITGLGLFENLGVWFFQMLYTIGVAIINEAVTILVFLRFATIYIFKALSPVMLAPIASDEWKSISIGYIKQVMALLAQSFVLIIIIKLVPVIIASNDAIQTQSYWAWVGTVAIPGILKLAVVIFLLVGSQGLTKRLLGV